MAVKKSVTYLLFAMIFYSSCSIKVPIVQNQDCGRIKLNEYIDIMNNAGVLAKVFPTDLKEDTSYHIKDTFNLKHTFINFIDGGNKLIFHIDSIYYFNGLVSKISIGPAVYCEIEDELHMDFKEYVVYSQLYYDSCYIGKFQAEYHSKAAEGDSIKYTLREIKEIPREIE